MSRLGLHGAARIISLHIAGAVFATLMAASADRALAADWPLRGSLEPSFARWDGWQFGVLAGYGNLNTDFGNTASEQVAFILRNSTLEAEGAPSSWTTLPKNTTNGPVFGAFVAYNWQWSELVLGLDLAYKYPSILKSSVGGSIERLFDTSDNVQHDVTIAAQSSFKLVDYATLRARAGYAVGQFLPYAVAGVAVGRFNFGTSVTVTDVQTQLPIPPGGALGTFQQTSSVGRTNVFAFGVAAGLGVDWAITPGVFLRAEWEYVGFTPVDGTRANTNIGLLGAGVRF
jgi:outer membrane immunogenic protein